MKTVKMLPHEWAKANENQHHRFRIESNGRMQAGSYSNMAQVEYVMGLYRRDCQDAQIVDGVCTLKECRHCNG